MVTKIRHEYAQSETSSAAKQWQWNTMDFVNFCFGRTDVISSSLTSLLFVTTKGSVDDLDCLSDLFPLNGHLRHSDELELLEDLDASFNKILITDGSISVTNEYL